MNINLDDLRIEAALKPTKTWKRFQRDWERYSVLGLINGMKVGNITINRALNPVGNDYDSFFFDTSNDSPISKPYIYDWETLEEFRGNSICGKLIILANEFYKGHLGTTLYSETHFENSFQIQSKRVWQKLLEKGLAVYEPFQPKYGELKDRWYVI